MRRSTKRMFQVAVLGVNAASAQVVTWKASPLVLDHTGADLYRPAFVGGLCESSEYQSFNIDKTTGKLKLLGSSAQKFLFSTPLSFSGNNVYAYGSDCIDYKGSYLDTFQTLKRESNGFLAD